MSLGLVVLSLVGILLFSGHKSNKTAGIILLATIYMIEVIEDCIWGHYQSLDMLYVGTQKFCFRWMAIFAVFIVAMVRTRNMITALVVEAVTSKVVFVVWVVVLRHRASSYKEKSVLSRGLSWLPSMVR